MCRIALVPAYEPEPILLKLVKELRQSGFETVVVDDGSGEQYRSLFQNLQDYAVVLSYETNRGKGYAMKQGMLYIREHYSEGIVITLDADGQHLVSDAERLCASIQTNQAKMMIGSRYLSSEDPLRSRFGNRITRFVYRVVTGVCVYDTQSGLRAFRVDLIPELLRVPGERYEYEMNVLLIFARQGIAMGEIPIQTIYFDKKNSVSHFNTLTDSEKIYGGILKFTCSSLTSFLVDYALYSILLLLLGSGKSSLLAANLGARLVSSVFNFSVNKRFVFQSGGNLFAESVKYFALVLMIISINSIILTALTQLGCNAYVAKILVEVFMFFVSYTIQSRFIFLNGRKVKAC